MGLSLIILDVGSGGDVAAAFATAATRGADSLLVGSLESHFPSQATLNNPAPATGDDDDLVGETDYPMSPASSWLWCGKLRLIAGIF